MNNNAAVISNPDTDYVTAAPHRVTAGTLDAAMRWRYAVRRFTDDTISQVELEALLDAVRLSPSVYGLQPYQLLVISSRQVREQLLAHSYGQDKVVNCSNLVVFAAHKDIDDPLVDRYITLAAESRRVSPEAMSEYATQVKNALGAQTREQRAGAAVNQAFLALGTLLTSAALLGIDCCPMSGFDTGGYDEVLNLPQRGLTAAVICALGRRHPQDSSAAYPRVRVPRGDWLLEY